MVMESGVHPGELKDAVCSPSGSTISGVFELENAGFRSALLNAVQSSSKRAYEIGLIENYDTASEATYASREHLAYQKFLKSQNSDEESPRKSTRQKVMRRSRALRDQQ